MRYFLAVAEELNITRAARRLHISQPPLSRQLSQLEEELGVTLFLRGKRKLELTEEGKYLMQQARDILNMASHTEARLSQMQKGEVRGTLLLGVTETCSASILPAVLPLFREKYPGVSYDILCGSSNEVCRKLEEGILDIGIIRDPFNLEKFESHFLKKESWMAVVGKGHPLEKQKEITPEELAGASLFVPSRPPLYEEICGWFGGEAKVLGKYNQVASILPLIAENMGVGICPESVDCYADSQRVTCLKLVKPERTSCLYMVRQTGRLLPAGGRVFWDFLRDQGPAWR